MPSSMSATQKPTQATQRKSPEDSTYFDQFLKSTTQITPHSSSTPFSSIDLGSTTFGFENFTEFDVEDFNSTNISFKTMVYDQETKDNNLENTTEYRSFVEEMFESSDSNRTKRQVPYKFSESEGKQTIFVSCHNAGGFKSARQRYVFVYSIHLLLDIIYAYTFNSDGGTLRWQIVGVQKEWM